ncbi:hypothetical protein GYH30_044898 [Glycine max]|nr:hypothetical protein GYH30_044898 [Glycine max]
MDNMPRWEIENGHRLVEYNDTRHYKIEVSVPLIPSNTDIGVTVCGYAKIDDVVPDYENELSDCVDNTVDDISIGFTDSIGLVKFNHNVICVNLNNIYFVGYVNLGDPSQICPYCQVAMWYQERTRKNRKQTNPKYSLCCNMGNLQLPFLKNPPMLLQQLLCDDESHKNRNYQQYIRAYNMMFTFHSPGAKIYTSLLKGKGPTIYKIHGQSCHLIGSLLPMAGKPPQFSQLYIYDTKNEIENRIGASSCARQNLLDLELVSKLKDMLDEYNVFVSQPTLRWEYEAKSQRSIFQKEKRVVVSTNVYSRKTFEKQKRQRKKDGRIYNLPTVLEVITSIVGVANQPINRDIILEKQSGRSQRINELHPGYLGLQYPLLFPYGEDGYRNDINHRDMDDSYERKRNRLTIKEFLCFRLHSKKDEAQTLLRSRRLFQQFIVDGYKMMEAEQLLFTKTYQ